jgi:hypothetical protein
MKGQNKFTIKKGEIPSVAITNLLSSIFRLEEISVYKVRMSEFAKVDILRRKLGGNPAHVYEKGDYAAEYFINSITFEKKDLVLPVSLSGFNIMGKFTFMGEVSKFYLPAGLVYSTLNNRVESAIPKDVLNLIVEVETPAVVVFDLNGGYSGSNWKFYVESLSYLFKESGKYLVVVPFSDMIDYSTPMAKSMALRFFEFFLNLVQFFNENEKVTPFCYDIVRPELLTEPLVKQAVVRFSSDPAHGYSLKIIGAVNTAINEDIVNKVNEVYSKARNSFIFLGQHPIEALEKFTAVLRVLG